ncbi:PriCT-2 domain-containing protein [Cupriavidus basilensis]
MQYEHTPEKIRAALTHIPADDRERWLRTCMAIKNYFGDDGWPLFNEWSESAANYNAAAAKATWKSCKASGGVGIGTLLREAMAGASILSALARRRLCRKKRRRAAMPSANSVS